MSVIFFYKPKPRRNRKSGFFRNLLLILVGCLLAYHYFDYIFPDTHRTQQSLQKVKSINNTENEIVAKIKPRVIIPIEEPQNSPIPLLATSKPKTKPKSVVKNTAEITNRIALILQQANQLINDNKIIQARKLLNKSLAGYIADDDNKPLINLAIKLGQQTILSEYVYADDPLCQWYKVKPGELLVRIAKRCKVPYKLLCRINHIANPRRLRAGQKIKLIFGPVNAKVVIHDLVLYLYLQDTLIGGYDVGLGKNNKTPTGTWLVADRVRKPVYRDPDTGEIYAPDAPDNPTGGYWIRIRGIAGNAVGKVGFGIHGTNDPTSIGKFKSKGCIRLRNEDISEVFDMLKPGLSKVETIP